MHLLIIWKCSTSKILDSKFYSWKATSKHSCCPHCCFCFFFLFTPIWLTAFPDICSLTDTLCLALCWHSLPCPLHFLLACLECPHPCPLKAMLCPDLSILSFSYSTSIYWTSLMWELFHLAPLSGMSASSHPPPWFSLPLLSPTHHLRHSLGDTSSKKPLLTILSIPSSPFPITICACLHQWISLSLFQPPPLDQCSLAYSPLEWMQGNG